MVTLEVNGRLIEAKEGETILSALRRNGISVPTLCHMEGLLPSGACRLCVVEIEGMRNLIPSCSYPVADGMRIATHSLRAIDARKTIVELLLANHPDDCLYCERNNTCELQRLAVELGIRERRYSGAKNNWHVDASSPAIVRDPAKCVLCGKCIRTCEEVQGVAAIDFTGRGSRALVAPAFRETLNVSSCVNCGQCVAACPTGALIEHSSVEAVMQALADPQKQVVIQHAPAVSVSIAEELGLKAGSDVQGLLTAALRRIGFKRVFDTSFAADLTIMEEATELVTRIKNGGVLPMITSCSPAWIKFAETFYPEFLPNLSTCKSPQQMLGAVIKRYWAPKQGIAPERVFSVAVMPCTAKKFEAQRAEMVKDGIPDIDAVLTTRELAKMIRRCGIAVETLEPELDDLPFGVRSSAGKLFGATGGVMEAAIRTAHYLITGTDLVDAKITPLRGPAEIKEFSVKVGDLILQTAVVNGLSAARKVLEEIKAGKRTLHFLEIMSCPGGCVGGGGQPYGISRDKVRIRMQALYAIDQAAPVRASHHNKEVAHLYQEFLGQPNSHLSHELLHTSYRDRSAEILK